MANNKIRVRSATEYVIEVNDRGETISFDTSDSGLALRMIEAFEKLDQLYVKCKKAAEEIDQTPDEPFEKLLDGEFSLTKNTKAGLTLIEDFYKDARAAMDVFLGEGACQKIFGNKNYMDMFNDLAEQLEPHFKKMGLDTKTFKEKALQKHGLNRQQRRALK